MPTLKPGEKIHYPIYHDETCVHANDQSNFVWIKEDEQPLHNKSCGHIVHVSDFIIEHSGHVVLSDDEIMEQMKLPEKPLPPAPDTKLPSSETPPSLAEDPAVDATAVAPPEPTGKKTKSQKQKEPKKKKTPNKKPVTTAQTLAAAVEDEWVPPLPPAPFPSYRLSSFDAQHIIYPGANYIHMICGGTCLS